MNAFDNLVTCPKCPHGAGLHDGSGCSAPACNCRSTKEAVLSESIDLMWREDRDRYPAGGNSNN